MGLAGERVVNNFKFYAVFKDSEDYTVRSGSDEIGTITTADGGVAAIGKLLPGTYYLVETKSPDGYKLLTDAVEIYIQLSDNETGYTVSYNQKGYSTSGSSPITPDTDGAYQITVSDPSGTVLPNSGGRGTLPFRIAGLALMLMGAAYVSYDFKTRRRRERRLRK